jgi:hypothetical protein
MAASFGAPFSRGGPGYRPPIIQPRIQSQAAPTQINWAVQTRQFEDGFSDDQIRAKKEYERYLARIRQIERNFVLQNRKSDQASRKRISHEADAIASLYNESIQLLSQYRLYERKVNATKTSLEATRNRGMHTILMPLKSGIESFGIEMEKAIKTTDELLSNMKGQITNLVKEVNDLRGLSTVLSSFDIEIDTLNQGHQKSAVLMEQIRSGLTEALDSNRESTVQALNASLKRVSLRIDTLVKRSQLALSQCETVRIDTQTAQFDFRKLFRKSIEKSMARFSMELGEIKADIIALGKLRLNQVDTVRNRLALASDEISQVKVPGRVDRFSLQPDIDAINNRIQRIEAAMRGEQPKAKKKAKTRGPLPLASFYYRVLPTGMIECLFVIKGTVIM